MAIVRPGRHIDTVWDHPGTGTGILLPNPGYGIEVCPGDTFGTGTGTMEEAHCRIAPRKRLIDCIFIKREVAPGIFAWFYYRVWAWVANCVNLEGFGGVNSYGELVAVDCNPPFGIPTVLSIQWNGFPEECSADTCPTSTVTYDPSSETWKGSLGLVAGTAEIEIICTFVIDPITEELVPQWGIYLTGCVIGTGTTPLAAQLGITCPNPLRMTFDGLAFGSSNICCDGFTGVATIGGTIKGPQKFHASRLIDYGSQGSSYTGTGTAGATIRQTYGVPQCCPDDIPCGTYKDCCPGVLIPLTLTLTVIGSCAAGTYSMTYDGVQYWTGSMSGCVNTPTLIRAECTFSSGQWIWTVVGTSPPFCGFAAAQTPPSETWECDPLEVDFGNVSLFGCAPPPGLIAQTAHLILTG